MGWINEDHEAYRGHEGYLLALTELRPQSGLYRELGSGHNDDTERSVHLVVVACECGWRSPRLVAPRGTRYAPYIVLVPDPHEGFEDHARALWHRHLSELKRTPYTAAWSGDKDGYVLREAVIPMAYAGDVD